MVVKYCPKCQGHPYTKNLSETVCNVCGERLKAENIDETKLQTRPKLPSDEPDLALQPETASDALSGEEAETSLRTVFGGDDLLSSEQGVLETLVGIKEPQKIDRETPWESSGTVTVRGRVSQYSVSAETYRRLFPRKIFQAIVYHQRLEDVLHYFTVRIEEDQTGFGNSEFNTVPVNVHGTISGGMPIVENTDVEVRGKYNRDGVLMASSVYVVNGGHKAPVTFQRSVKAIVCSILLFIAVAVVLALGFSSDDFVGNIQTFACIWLVTFVGLSVLYLIFRFSRAGLLIMQNKGCFPFVPLLITSFVLAVLFMFLARSAAVL